MPGKVALIGCSARKLHVPEVARKLYQGALFQKSVAWAESHDMPWGVLSAKYDLVLPDTVIEPYDLTLRDLPRDIREAWGKTTGEAIEGAWPDATFVFLAGEYYKLAVAKFEERVEFPLLGMGIGQRMAWLKRNMKAVPA